MIAFGSAITDPNVYEAHAEPGIELARESDSVVFALPATGSLQSTYNLILDQATGLDGLEALVLLHQDAELIDSSFCAVIREALRDPEVAIVGCAGAVGVRNINYWEGSVTWANFTHRFEESGGGDVPGLTWLPERTPSYAHTGEVESIDGFVIVMSPWAVRELRFDESLGNLHGYDLDICLQARVAGKKVMTADFRAIHHHSLELIRDVEGWIAAHMQMAEKWEGVLRDGRGGDWKQRARRAEAEAAVARLQLELMKHFATLRGAELDAVTTSRSWKLTRPLRWLMERGRSTRARLRRGGDAVAPRS
jgi:hypothetical protein